MSKNLSDVDTRWTRMRLARQDTPEGRAALADVVREYWEPLYHYVRRSGRSQDDAQDLTQGFVEFMLATRLIQKADPEKGSFRGLLKASFNNYIRKDHRKQNTQARGGDVEHVDLDFQTAETRYRAEIVKRHL